jgi:pimeloyl-ACP methyl ester carboxylesterase
MSDEIARIDRGLVVILPGIEGKGISSESIREGLIDGGVRERIETFEWGMPVPGLGMAFNQMDVARNRDQAEKLAIRIYEYQRAYPGRPVFLVGHSGGSGVAVFALEALSRLRDAKPVNGAVLIASSLSADYNLSSALKNTRYGIVSVSNPFDLAVLGIGTAAMGNVDGTRSASAGRTGFAMEDARLFKMPVTVGMLRGIRITPHQAATTTSFVRKNIAPWITQTPWPPKEMIEHLKPRPGKENNGTGSPDRAAATRPARAVMGCPRM